MFIKKLEINNFRCFGSNFTLPEFHIPDGTDGSGLNIFVGENATGKTSVLDVFDLLVRNPFSSRRRVSLADFRDDDPEQKIEVNAYTDEEFEVSRLWGNNKFKSNGFFFYATIRSRDESKRLLDNIVLDNEFIPTDESSTIIKPVEKRQTASGPYTTDRMSGFDIFYLDKNRDRHIDTKTYSSKLLDVLKDLDFQYLKSLSEKSRDDLEEIAKRANEQTKKVHDFTKKDKIITDAIQKIKKNIGIDIKLDFIKLLEPYSSSFLTQREEKSLRQIPISKLGSGIEVFVALLFLDTIYDAADVSVVYCIDEPELHLHPQFQGKLLEFLNEASKSKQVFIATQSPYFIKTELIDHVYRFRKTKNNIKVFAPSNTLKVKENRIFFFHHRPLFFTDKAVFVEGVTDYDRLIKYCTNNGYEYLVSQIFFLGGKGDGRFFREFCEVYGIKAYFAYDIDYIEDDIKEFFNGGLTIESDKKDKKQWYRENFNKIKGKYEEKKGALKKENIFIWSKPDIKDVFDEGGNPQGGMKEEVEDLIKLICEDNKKDQNK